MSCHWNVMLCYVMLFYAILCYTMLCVMLCYVKGKTFGSTDSS